MKSKVFGTWSSIYEKRSALVVISPLFILPLRSSCFNKEQIRQRERKREREREREKVANMSPQNQKKTPRINNDYIIIKGYLAVRLILASSFACINEKSDDDDDHDEIDQSQSEGVGEETFFYVREHRGNNNTTAKESSSNPSNNDVKPGCTLFVANAPTIPGISTKILLKSIFGRFATSGPKRVTIIKNPRNVVTKEEQIKEEMVWSTKVKEPTFLTTIHSEGKYAHIVFESPKDLKKTMKSLHEIMKQPAASRKEYHVPGLILDPIEIQTLSDESHRINQETIRKLIGPSSSSSSDSDDGDEDEDGIVTKKHAKQSIKSGGIYAIAERYRQSCNYMSRSQLLEECNTVIQSYEDAEEAKRQAIELSKSQPDEDGFITVTHSTVVGSAQELDESFAQQETSTRRRKGGTRRNRGGNNKNNSDNTTRKKFSGADELHDFYRFQRRDNRKRNLEDLRKQFEDDLQRVKRMKQEKQYRPF